MARVTRSTKKPRRSPGATSQSTRRRRRRRTAASASGRSRLTPAASPAPTRCCACSSTPGDARPTRRSTPPRRPRRNERFFDAVAIAREPAIRTNEPRRSTPASTSPVIPPAARRTRCRAARCTCAEGARARGRRLTRRRAERTERCERRGRLKHPSRLRSRTCASPRRSRTAWTRRVGCWNVRRGTAGGRRGGGRGTRGTWTSGTGRRRRVRIRRFWCGRRRGAILEREGRMIGRLEGTS
mmetsp:Transcript_9746/g.39496  ORF Transcript_9746/g.39496 Transcript_9746/m.39496 type:complete len:241 (-) Transcript_9746:34-756(-)